MGALTVLMLLVGAAITLNGMMRLDFAHVSSGLAYIIGMTAFLFFLLVWKIENGKAAFFGRISYSMYLLHPVALYVASWVCMTYGIAGLPLGAYMAVTLLPAVFLAWASFRFIEQAGIDLSYRLTRQSHSTYATT